MQGCRGGAGAQVEAPTPQTLQALQLASPVTGVATYASHVSSCSAGN